MKAIPVPSRRWRRVLMGVATLGVLSLSVALVPGAALEAGDDPPPSASDEPTFVPRGDVLLWSDDFDVSERITPAGIGRGGGDSRYGPYVTLGASHLQFARGEGLGGSGALRITWVASTSRAVARCSDDSRLIEASFPPARELTVQYSVRYTPGFVFDWGRGGRCDGNAKKLFLLWARSGSRFVFISENGRLGVGSDEDHPLLGQDRATAMLPSALADGQWHRITLRILQSSAPERADGAVHGWIDGVQRWSHDGIVTHNAGGYHLFKLPATFNQGSPVAQAEWLDDLRIWRPR